MALDDTCMSAYVDMWADAVSQCLKPCGVHAFAPPSVFFPYWSQTALSSMFAQPMSGMEVFIYLFFLDGCTLKKNN